MSLPSVTPQQIRTALPDSYRRIVDGEQPIWPGSIEAKNEADGIEVLEAGVKQYLAELDDKQFAALVGEVREPESDAGDAPPKTQLGSV